MYLVMFKVRRGGQQLEQLLGEDHVAGGHIDGIDGIDGIYGMAYKRHICCMQICEYVKKTVLELGFIWVFGYGF
jgi:hypothetical protein